MNRGSYKINNDRVDIMVDIESLSMEPGGTLLQICAKKFNIHSGKEYSEFNMYIDISKESVHASGDTIKWWLEDKGRNNVLQDILRKGRNSEEYVINEFHKWIGTDTEYDNTYLWGNGILDDNRVLKEKFDKYGLNSPIKYDNHRDLRTIVELACYKENISLYDFIGKNMDKSKNNRIHNALNDVNFQIKLLVSAFKVLKF